MSHQARHAAPRRARRLSSRPVRGRHASRPPVRRVPRPLRTAALAGVVVAVAGGAATGTAYAFWGATGSGVSAAGAATGKPLTTSPVSVSANLLYPGATGDAKVVINNPNPYPVTVSAITGGTVTSDKGAACDASTGVTFATQSGTFAVPASGSQTFTLAGAVSMSNASDSSCQGASFAIPVTLTGSSS